MEQEGLGRAFHLRIGPSEQISFFHTNSIYGAPVEEVIEVRNRNLVLKAVRTASPAVMEYYGFESSGPVQVMDKSLGSALSIQTGMRQDQGFRIGRRTVDLDKIAPPGSRIRLTVRQVSQARFLWWTFLHKDRSETWSAP